MALEPDDNKTTEIFMKCF